MKKFRFLSLLLVTLLVTACNHNSSSSSSSSSSSTSSSSTVVNTPYDNGYYKDILILTTGDTLKSELRILITSTHKTQVSYGDIRYMFKDSDKAASGKMQTFYAHAEIDGTWDQGNTYNREHVWPKSKSWFSKVTNSTKGAGADLHHIRPTITNINSARGDSMYAEFDEKAGKEVNSMGYLGGYRYNDTFEPLEHSKGDIARIIFYLLTRYQESDSYQITNVAQSYEMLLRWNELDPVDDVERNRNEYVYGVQGNRNPFIDYPEMADKIWATV